jgi:PTS system mannose-specific IIA component
MIGVLLVTHKDLADALLAAYDVIFGRQEGMVAVSLDPTAPPDVLRQTLQRALAQVNNGDGVVILTDMLGGTPSNLSLSYLQEGKVEVVTGVNLPMLMQLSSLRRQGGNVASVARALKESGQEGITVASEVLRRK